MVKVTLVPTPGFGLSTVMEIPTSANPATVVVAVPLSLPGLGSAVEDVAVAVLLSTVPAGTLGSTATFRVNTGLDAASEGFVHVTVPAEPTGGVVHDQPAAGASDTKVGPAGSVSASETAAALLGPALVAVIV